VCVCVNFLEAEAESGGRDSRERQKPKDN